MSVPNRRLTADELTMANKVLDLVRSRIDELCGTDKPLRFAYNRKIAKELGYDERGKPTGRIRLKAQKRKSQKGMCALGAHQLPQRGSVLDRLEAERGYTAENTRLLCPDCDAKVQADRGYR